MSLAVVIGTRRAFSGFMGGGRAVGQLEVTLYKTGLLL